MATIAHKKGNLFDAPSGSVLVHACNAQGMWGSGIAKEFAERFPESYDAYKNMCLRMNLQAKPFQGEAFVLGRENEHRVGCLITSSNYGQLRDPKDVILKNTRIALQDMLGITGKLNCWIGEDEQIHSCKFNSGLFGVPWDETEKILLEVMDEARYNRVWTIWEI